MLCHRYQDGDATDASSWTCASGEVCEITYDLQAAESLEQLRIGKYGASGLSAYILLVDAAPW